MYSTKITIWTVLSANLVLVFKNVSYEFYVDRSIIIFCRITNGFLSIFVDSPWILARRRIWATLGNILAEVMAKHCSQRALTLETPGRFVCTLILTLSFYKFCLFIPPVKSSRRFDINPSFIPSSVTEKKVLTDRPINKKWFFKGSIFIKRGKEP